MASLTLRALMQQIEQLEPADLDACLALAGSRGWRPERRRWRLLFASGAVYGVRAEDGGLAGCVSLVRYGGGLAAVGMMLVAERCERQGLGRRLMEHALGAAEDDTVFLYATPFGQPLYERLGFRVRGAATSCIGPFGGVAAGVTRIATPADRAAIAALDAAAFGADRGAFLGGYFAFADELRVLERDGVVCGFGAVAANAGNAVVGPVVAPDLDAGRALIADLAADVGGPVRLDIDHRHGALLAWAAEHGVAPGDQVTFMVRDGRELPGERERLILPVMLAVG
jgi:predicted N-acetyltransferase YhbS